MTMSDFPTQLQIRRALALAPALAPALALALAPALAFADPPPSLSLTLSGVPARVLSHNPSLAAARHRVDEALGRLDQSGRPANPELETEYRTTSATGENGFEISLNQAFPLTARLRLEKEVSRAELAIAEAEIGDAERRLVADARRLAIRHLAGRDAVALRRRQGEVAEELASFISKAAGRGEGSALDAGEARLEASRLELDIERLTADADSILAELKPLLGLLPAAHLALTGALPGPALPGAAVNPSSRPDYRALLHAVDAAEREVALARANRVEDVRFGIVGEFVREEDAPTGIEDESILGIRFSIPLPLWNRNEGTIREKEAARQRAEGEADALAGQIRNEAAAALGRMRSQLTLLEQIDAELLPLAERQLTLSDTAFRGGQSDLQTVLRARDRKIAFVTARLDALRDFNLARVDYESARGQSESTP